MFPSSQIAVPNEEGVSVHTAGPSFHWAGRGVAHLLSDGRLSFSHTEQARHSASDKEKFIINYRPGGRGLIFLKPTSASPLREEVGGYGFKVMAGAELGETKRQNMTGAEGSSG